MKKLLLTLLIIPLIGCANLTNYLKSDSAIVTVVSTATTAGLQYVIKDSSKRTAIANYLEVYSHALRTITGTPTAAELTVTLNGFVPASVSHAYPEIAALVLPIIVSNYQAAIAKYGANAKEIYRVASDIATGIEAGAAPYVTHTGSVTVNG